MNSVVTIGTFDGVHRGHKEVLTKVLDIAHKRKIKPIAVTFDRHPLEVTAPGRAPKMLMDSDSRDSLIRAEGVDVVRIPFTDDVRRVTAARWMRSLRDELGMRVLVLGYDNSFGCDGATLSLGDYRRIGESLGIDVVRVEALPGCSSSAARSAVANGDMPQAAGILGRPFSISGEVIHGRQLGRTIGIPTANLNITGRQLLPLAGVYAAEAILPDGSRHRAVVNVGDNPTVESDGKTRVEAHICNFDGDLYGETITLNFARRIRGEQRFGSLADLRAQIRRDIAEA